MAFLIAVRSRPRGAGAARSCFHSCSVRFEVCNFNAASLCERFYSVHARPVIFVERHRLRTSDAEGDQAVSPHATLGCYTGITYSINSRGQNAQPSSLFCNRVQPELMRYFFPPARERARQPGPTPSSDLLLPRVRLRPRQRVRAQA